MNKTTKTGTVLAAGAALTALAALPGPAWAAAVQEGESDGTVVNNTLATAKVISGASFTPNVNPSVYGNLPTASVSGAGSGNDVDFFQFSTLGGTARFDIDNNPFSFDTILSLFNSAGTLIAFDDDHVADAGSATISDSFIGDITLAAGIYYIAVSEYGDFPNASYFYDSASALTDPLGEFGGWLVLGAPAGDSSFGASGLQSGLPYTLHISITGPTNVPEPATLALFGLGLAGIGAMRRKKLAA